MDNKEQLRQMIRNTLQIRFEGGMREEVIQAQRTLDAHMASLITSAKATRAQLLAMVQEERSLLLGASTSVYPRSEHSDVQAA